jgi:hypothetical protein
MSKEKTEKANGVENRLAGLHSDFLNAIRDTQPLAYLASLMLLLTVFSTGGFIGARIYAYTTLRLKTVR